MFAARLEIPIVCLCFLGIICFVAGYVVHWIQGRCCSCNAPPSDTTPMPKNEAEDSED